MTELEHCNEININQTKDQFSELRLFGRMNGAVTKGFEEDVGNRTSVYVHTEHSITASPYFFGKYGYKSAPHDEVVKLTRQQCDIVYTLHRLKIILLHNFSLGRE